MQIVIDKENGAFTVGTFVRLILREAGIMNEIAQTFLILLARYPGKEIDLS